jgi:hypothetical protein
VAASRAKFHRARKQLSTTLVKLIVIPGSGCALKTRALLLLRHDALTLSRLSAKRTTAQRHTMAKVNQKMPAGNSPFAPRSREYKPCYPEKPNQEIVCNRYCEFFHATGQPLGFPFGQFPSLDVESVSTGLHGTGQGSRSLELVASVFRKARLCQTSLEVRP